MIDRADVEAPAAEIYVPSENCPPPFANPSTPRLALPANSCDSHCHVLGPGSVFPYAPERTFTPHDTPKEQVLALHDHLGIDRGVVVQSSCNGTDHSVLLDALRFAPDRLRGVALLSPEMQLSDLRELHEAGVRGFRLNFLPHLRRAPDSREIDALIALAKPFGWHAEIHVQGTEIAEFQQLVSAVDVPVVIDHLARVDLSEGLGGPSVKALLELLDTGDVWVKISGVDRVSRDRESYRDGIEYAALLVRHAPERVLWGTDYPHVNIVGAAPDDGMLVDLLEEIAPGALLERVMVKNPAEFFDFPTDASAG